MVPAALKKFLGGGYAPLRRFLIESKTKLTAARFYRDYSAANKVRKLQIGCGPNLPGGWLNCDWYPSPSQPVLHVDATKRFPFDDNSFDLILSEHVIEHFAYEGGVSMLAECARVLVPGGRVRISTPDMKCLVDLYSEPKSQRQLDFIKLEVDVNRTDGIYTDTMVINMFFNYWGHVFLYDEKTLAALMKGAGLTDIRRYRVGESDEPNFRNVENVSRMPEGMLDFCSVVLEGTKPQ